MTDETIRIGFVGAGANTVLRHIPGFQAMDGVVLESVANRSRASGQRISDSHSIPTVYDTWVDLMDADDTNAICIGTWPYMQMAGKLVADYIHTGHMPQVLAESDPARCVTESD